MNSKNRVRWMFVALLFALLACSFPTAGKPTPTATVSIGKAGVVNGNTGGINNSSSNNPASSLVVTPSVSPSPSPNPSPSPTPTPALTPSSEFGPYLVVQIETVGGEKVTGFVCDRGKPFTINMSTPKAQFAILFTPSSPNDGTLAYSYDISSAGESHNATGKYTISMPAKNGTVQLAFNVSDHVVFKGFDGKIPLSYKLNLVPTVIPECQPTS